MIQNAPRYRLGKTTIGAACHHESLVSRRVLQLSLFVAYIVLVGTWLWAGRGPSIQPLGRGGLSSATGMVLWWSSPTLTLFFLQTRAGTAFAGTALLLVGGLALDSVYSSTHSTAGIGLFALPALIWLVALASLAAERLFRRPWSP